MKTIQFKNYIIDIFSDPTDYAKNSSAVFEDTNGDIVEIDNILEVECFDHITEKKLDCSIGAEIYYTDDENFVLSVIKLKEQIKEKELFTTIAHELGHMQKVPFFPGEEYPGNEIEHEKYAKVFEDFMSDVYDIVQLLKNEFKWEASTNEK